MPSLLDASPQSAQAAYDALAPAYDALTAGYCHDRWLALLEGLAIEHGLCGRRLLDVACGTGKSFLPLLAQGYEVTACDISQGMVDRAAAKAPAARVLRADMRSLPALGRFDLVTCLDDALNYILEEPDMAATLAGLARNLGDGGIALWDLNTLGVYRHVFAGDWLSEQEGILVGWRGGGDGRTEPGGRVHATVDVFAPSSDDRWERTTSVHRQRHWPREEITELAARAGLEVVAVRGQHRGAALDDQRFDELVHHKSIYVATRRRGEDVT